MVMNNLNVSGNLSVDNISAGVNYNNSYISENMISNTFDLNIALNTANCGTFEANAAYSTHEMLVEAANNSENSKCSSTLGVKYTYKFK